MLFIYIKGTFTIGQGHSDVLQFNYDGLPISLSIVIDISISQLAVISFILLILCLSLLYMLSHNISHSPLALKAVNVQAIDPPYIIHPATQRICEWAIHLALYS